MITAEEYVKFADEVEAQIGALKDKIYAAYKDVDPALPADLRPATPADIQPGRIIYYKHGDEGPFWQEVFEARHPDDAWKAYVAGDGCRYGLHDAWVRVSPVTEEAAP